MKKSVSILLIIASLMSLGGCSSGGTIYSNHRKVDELQLVRALGIDLGEQSAVELSVSTTLGKKDEKAPTILRASGPNLTRSLEFLQEYASRDELFLAPTTSVIIGEEAAEEGIEPFLDYIQRSTQIRLETDLFIVKGGTAGSLFAGSAGSEYEVSEMMSSLKHEVKQLGVSRVSSIRDVSKDLSESGVSLVCAVQAVELTEVVPSEEPEITVARQAGFAVIKDGRLAGFLSGTASRGACFLLGIAADGTALIEDESGLVSLAFSGSGVGMKPVWEEGRLARLIISIDLDSAVQEQSGRLSVDDPAVCERLGLKLADYVRSLANEALEASRSMNADFLGVGRRLNSRHPIRFAAIDGDWENVWRNLEIELDIDATVKRRFDIGNPQSFDGSDKVGKEWS